MKMKRHEIVDELVDIKNKSAFVAEGLASGLLLEIKQNGIMSNSGIEGACTISLDITYKLDNLIENFSAE